MSYSDGYHGKASSPEPWNELLFWSAHNMFWVPARNFIGYFYINDLNGKFQFSTNDYFSGSFFLAYGKI